MSSLHVSQWQFVLRKTQSYLRSRILGNDCNRDQIEAWRQFYSIHEPRVRALVVAAGMPSGEATGIAEEVWLDIVALLPSLPPQQQTEDSFGFWLARLVREKVRQSRCGKPAESLDHSAPSENPDACIAENVNDRLLHLRIAENQTVERIARTLRLSCDEVVSRQRQLLRNILRILVQLDAVPVA